MFRIVCFIAALVVATPCLAAPGVSQEPLAAEQSQLVPSMNAPQQFTLTPEEAEQLYLFSRCYEEMRRRAEEAESKGLVFTPLESGGPQTREHAIALAARLCEMIVYKELSAP